MVLIKLLLLLFTSSLVFGSYPEISQAVKEKKIYPMGEKIYKKRCENIDVSKFHSYDEMQKTILSQNLCKSLNKKYFQSVSLYLWDKTRVLTRDIDEKHIVVHKKDKCPVCGMFVYKYPKWATQISYKDTKFVFDGVKDMMKYYFEHKEGIEEKLVRDYYTQKVIDAKKAYFVTGSNVYGPMGNELIAFSDEKSAKTFYLDHQGKKILPFSAITSELVYGL